MRGLRGVVSVALAALVLVAAGCGGGDDNKGGGKSGAPVSGKQGGTLTVVNLSDVDSMDPGYWYYQTDYQLLYQTTQRGLYGWEAPKTEPSPDLAEGMPKTSSDGKTVTI